MSYHHLTLRERGKIELMLKQGQTPTAMAREVGYDASTVRREIQRNGTPDSYDAQVAQRREHAFPAKENAIHKSQSDRREDEEQGKPPIFTSDRAA